MDRQAVKLSCLTNTSLYSAGFSHLPVTNVPDCCIKLYIQPILQLQSKGFPSNLRLVIAFNPEGVHVSPSVSSLLCSSESVFSFIDTSECLVGDIIKSVIVEI